MKYYTHKINLLERTKLLEGIVCQSLAFTDRKGTSYLGASVSACTELTDEVDITGVYYLDNSAKQYLRNLYFTPIAQDSELTVFSIYSVAEQVANLISGETGVNVNVVTYNDVTQLNAVINGQSYSQVYTSSALLPIVKNLNTTAELNYTICVRVANPGGSTGPANVTYTVKYVIKSVKEYYPLKPWTITSAINRVLDLAEPIYLGETPRFELNPIQAQKWNNTPLPNTTMTQCTLREQLQHIGNYIHGQARLGGYLNESITFNNKTYSAGYYENMIFFDEYGGAEESTLQDKPYSTNQTSHSINEYNTRIETSAQNIVNSIDYADGVITAPDSINFKTLRTESANVRLSESNCFIETDFPIYDVVSLKVKVYSGDGDQIYIDTSNNNAGIWDVTPFLFESHEYENLSSYGGGYPYAKKYAMYYTQGQKNIKGLFVKPKTEIGEVFGDYWTDYSIAYILESVAPSINWKNIVTKGFPLISFQISYIPFYETKYSHTDGYIIGQERSLPYSKIYNQSENVIEARFYGENIKGVAQRLGNKEAVRTYILGDINDVPKVGTMLDGYYISQVVTEYMPFSIKCTLGLTENFNRLSQNVGINSHKRVAEVSEREAYERNILIKEYICIGSNVQAPLKGDVCQYRTNQATMLMLTGISNSDIADENYDVQTVAVSRFYRKNDFSDHISIVKSPVVSSAFGNCMTFSWNMQDNYSAGTEISTVKIGDDKSYWQTSVPYGDYYGRAYWLYFDLFTYLPNSTGLESALTCRAFEEAQTIPRGKIIRNLYPYLLRKDSREIIKMNLAIEYVTNRKDLVVCSALAYCNPLVSNAKKGKVPKVYFFADKTRAFDNIRGRTIKAFEDLEAIDNKSFYFNIYVGNFKSWVIAYPTEEKQVTVYNEDTGENETYTEYSGGEILIACNNDNWYYVYNKIYQETLYIKKYSDRNKDYESV